METGFNTNITIKGKVFHIQTEVIKGAQPTIESLVYVGGTIVHSVKTPIASLIGSVDEQKRISNIVESQHRGLLLALRKGKNLRLQTNDSKISESPSPHLESSSVSSVSGGKTSEKKLDMSQDSDQSNLAPGQSILHPNRQSDQKPSQTVAPAASEELSLPVKREQAPSASANSDGPTVVRYVAGSDIRQSDFLQKIQLQTDKMKALRMTRAEKPAERRRPRVADILDGINEMVQGIRLSGIIVSGELSALEVPDESDSGKFSDLIRQAIPAIEQFLEAMSAVGKIEENILTFHYNRLFIYKLDHEHLCIVLVDRERPVELVRNACLPAIRRLQEFFSLNSTE